MMKETESDPVAVAAFDLIHALIDIIAANHLLPASDLAQLRKREAKLLMELTTDRPDCFAAASARDC